MVDVKYREIMWASMAPDVYDGPRCDQIRPRWHGFCEGDMDSDFSDVLELAAKHFPPGTKITIEEPECPVCGQTATLCRVDDGCGFDWDRWTLEQYS